MTTPRIAIVGAGVAGLTLARVLQVHGIRSTVFELDTSARSRDQGGTLDLRLESGQAALHAAGLFEKFSSFIRADGQEIRLLDKHAKLHLHSNSSDNTTERPEIDRGDLRQILVDSIYDGTIHWATRVKEIKPSQDDPNMYTVVYNGDNEGTFDLVVGADGAWSKVRPLLSEAKPLYSGVSFIELRFTDFQVRHPNIFQLVGGGSCFAVSDGQCLIAQVNADRNLRVYATFHTAEDQFSKLRETLCTPTEARRFLLDQYTHWDERLKDLIRLCDDDVFIPRPLYELPVPHVWKNKPGLTLIGDAAHLMSPFAGEGANMAMWDGAMLAQAIAAAVNQEGGHPLAKAIASFEQQMYEKTGPMAEMSASNLVKFTSPDGLEQVLKLWSTFLPHEQ